MNYGKLFLNQERVLVKLKSTSSSTVLRKICSGLENEHGARVILVFNIWYVSTASDNNVGTKQG